MKRLILLLGAVACASPAAPITPSAVAQGTSTDSMASQLPIGQGRLNQDVLTLRVGTGSLDIRFVPLEESVMRLLSQDGYRALSTMISDQRAMLDSLSLRRGVREPGLALVTFYGLAPNTRFDPQLLTVSLRNQLYRPVAILPLSPSFSNQQLDVRGQATAIFVFERPLPVLEPFTVSYLTSTTSEWERKLPRLNAERSRILGRAKAVADSGSGTP
jgi:hypothetical protein